MKHGSTIVRCRACGLAYVTPPPSAEALTALYGDERHYQNLNASPFGYLDYLGERLVARRLHAIERRVGRQGRFLDVGCATSVLVEAAGARGWNAVGVDVSTFATAQCHARGLDVRRGDLWSTDRPAEHFEAVVLDDTIEHTLTGMLGHLPDADTPFPLPIGEFVTFAERP